MNHWDINRQRLFYILYVLLNMSAALISLCKHSKSYDKISKKWAEGTQHIYLSMEAQFFLSINGGTVLFIYQWRHSSFYLSMEAQFFLSINGGTVLFIYQWRHSSFYLSMQVCSSLLPNPGSSHQPPEQCWKFGQPNTMATQHKYLAWCCQTSTQ